jgi:hypothetical protein
MMMAATSQPGAPSMRALASFVGRRTLSAASRTPPLRTKSQAWEERVSRLGNDSSECQIRYSCVGAPIPLCAAVERAIV